MHTKLSIYTLPVCSLTQLTRPHTKVINHILKPVAYRRGDWMTLQASHLCHCRITWIYGFEKVETDKIVKTVENLSWVVLLIPSQNIKIVGTDQKGSKSSSQHQQCWFVLARNRNVCMEKTLQHRETGQPAGETWQLSSKGFIWSHLKFSSPLPCKQQLFISCTFSFLSAVLLLSTQDTFSYSAYLNFTDRYAKCNLVIRLLVRVY